MTWSAVCKLQLYPRFARWRLIAGIVGGGNGYSAGGAGGNDSIALVVVARWREKRSRDSAADGGGGSGGGSGRVVAVVLFLLRKGGRFLRDGLSSVRRVGGSRLMRRAVWWGHGHHLCRWCRWCHALSLPPRTRAREFVPRVALVLARRVSCVTLFSSRSSGRWHPSSSPIGHGAGG